MNFSQKLQGLSRHYVTPLNIWYNRPPTITKQWNGLHIKLYPNAFKAKQIKKDEFTLQHSASLFFFPCFHAGFLVAQVHGYSGITISAPTQILQSIRTSPVLKSNRTQPRCHLGYVEKWFSIVDSRSKQHTFWDVSNNPGA